MTLDPATLPAGVTYDSQIALLDTKNGTVSASIIGGRPLPDWLSFDAATRTVSLSGFAPDADAQLARLQVVFTPAPRVLPDGTYASSNRGFTLEFVVDPHGDLASQMTAINQALEGDTYFAGQGLIALDLSGAGAITATRESGAPLPDWLSFDPATFTFSGMPPANWVGAVPVRLDIAAGNGHPAMSIITEAVVDDTFKIAPFPASTIVSPGQINVTVPTDFNGTVVLSYDATDEKGGVSGTPALIFYDVKPTRERPDTAVDNLTGREGQTTRFAVTDLLRNDFDRDRDALRILSLGQPANGSLVIELAHANIAPPAGLGQLDGAVWSATLADGSALPTWLTIDSATGALSGDVPLAFASNLDIRFTRMLGGDSQSATLSQRFDGNSGAYVVYTPADAFSGDDGFSYVVTDDHEGPSTGSAIVHVAAVNDPPTTVEDTVAAIEDTPLMIDPATLLANDYDVDSNPIRFVGVANATHGTVSFDGTHIVFTPDHNFEGVATFEYIVTDDTNGSSTGQVKVNVASTNHAPIAATDVFATEEDTPFEFTTADLLGNDSDADSDTITFQSLSRSAGNGRIIELPDGRWQFVPNENISGAVNFSYTISDGRKTSTGTATFNVAAVNDAPIANPDGAGTANDPQGLFRTIQDQAITIDFAALIANDRDVEGDSFEIVEVFDGDQGTVVRVGSIAVFTPNAGYIGDAGFHYRVTDSHGASSVGFATLLVAPNVPLPIPVSDGGFEVLEDGFIDIDPAALMANDVTPDGSTLTFVGLEGAELLANGKYRVTPAANFNGELVLHYSVKNEQDFAVSTTVTINVLPVADAPVGRPDSLEMREDSPLTLFASQLLANDSDADQQAFVLTRIVATSGVTVADLGFGQLQITPNSDFNGPAWFDYEIEDSTGLTATTRVNINIAAVNDAPVISAVPVLKGIEDQRFSVTLPAGFVSDVDGDALLVEIRGKDGTALPAWLQYDPQTRLLSGDPPANFNGTIQLEIAASDGTAQTVRELLVSIAPVNDAPAIVSAIGDVDVAEDQPFSVALPTGAFADVDGDALTFAVTLGDGSPLPSWISVSNGRLIGTPPADFNGTLALAITASDGALSTSAGFQLNVLPVNDAPVLAHPLDDQAGREGEALDIALDKSAFADIDGDALTFTARLSDGNPLPAWLSFDGLHFTGTPPQNAAGDFDIEVTASDGTLAASDVFRLSIVSVNQAPVLSVPLADVSSSEDAPLSIAIPAGSFTDPNGDLLTYSATLSDGSALPSWLGFDGTNFTGTPPADFNGSFDILVTASDGARAASDVFRVTITPVNDAPVVAQALADVSSPEDTPVSITIPASCFADVDGDTLTYAATLADGSALPSWLSFDGTTFTGTPPSNYNGAIDIKVVASDGTLTASDEFRLTITPVDDAPVLAQPLADIVSPKNVRVTIPVPAGSFTDLDGDTLTLTATLSDGSSLPSWLAFDGATFTGTPPTNYTGAIDIKVTASDGSLTASDVFRLTIPSVNSAPVVAIPLPDVSSPEDTTISVAIPAGSFTDVNGNRLTYTAVLSSGAALPTWLAFDGTTFTGTPPANFNGTVSIKVTASDGALSASDIFVLTVTPVNDAPVLSVPLSDVNSAEDAAVSYTIPTGRFTDVDGNTLTYSATLADGSPLPSWLTLTGAKFAGTPPLNFNGAIDIRVTASDGTLSASDVFTLNITPKNDAPVLSVPLPDVTSPEDTPLSIALPPGSFTDVDGDTLTYTATLSTGAALPAWLAFDGTNFTGTPPANYNGTLNIKVTARDGALAVSDTFALTITPVNDAPVVAVPLSDVNSPEDTAISYTIPAGRFTDVDGNTLTYSATLADGSPLPSWLTLTGTRFTGTPPLNFNGAIDIRVTASDGSLSASDIFTLNITPKNDAPVLAVALPDVTSLEDTPLAIAIPPGSFTDVDGDTLTYTATLSSGAALPTWLSFDGTTFTGTPPANYNGTVSIKVTARDGALTASDIFTLTITPVNDAPVVSVPLSDVNSAEDAAVSFTIPTGRFTDPDGNTLTYTATLADGSPLPSWLTLTGTRFAGTPPLNFNGAIDIKVTASDGSLTASDVFTLTITPVNDKPVAANDGPFSVTHGDTLAIARASLLANDTDIDGDNLTIVSVGAPPKGTVVIDGQGVSYTPDFGYEGTDSFTYTISDGVATATATVSLTITNAFEGWVVGTASSETLTGDAVAANSIYGAGGNDVITGGAAADRLAGGIGNDTLNGNDGDDQFWGMAGNDTINGGNGTDTAYYNGVMSTYSIVTSAGSVQVTDNSTANGSDGVDTLTSIERLIFRNGETVTLAAPIILDLDGRGVETATAGQSSARFDIDGNGTADDTSWIGTTEAFLFLDRDRNGTVSGISELSFADDVAGARSDLEGLRAFDSNRDGMLSAGDIRFSDFNLWQDRNGDGTVEDGEILSLAAAGVRSINLAASATDGSSEFGSTVIVNRGSYTRTDGRTMDYADAVLTQATTPQLLSAADANAASSAKTLASALEILSADPAPSIGEQFWHAMDAMTGPDRPDAAAGIGPDSWAGHVANGVGTDQAPALLALMRQEMSVFGTNAGAADLAWRKDAATHPMDYFA